MEGSGRHVISIDDLTAADLDSIVSRGVAFADGTAGRTKPLADAVAGVYFRRTSTRTRIAFSSAALRLGAQLITIGPDDLQTNTGETSEDTGRVLARMLDMLVARTCGDTAELRGWAAQSRMSVLNAMSAAEHPTQALADLTTLYRHFGRLKDLRILYVGEGNNTAAALALALSRVPGVELEFRTPPGYGLADDIKAKAIGQAARSGVRCAEYQHMDDLPSELDVIYTTRWRTTGTSKPDARWRTVFEPFQVTKELWEQSPKAIFMHDLPAHRGDEVTADVLDGPMSIAFDQAANKMYSAMAILEWCRRGPFDGNLQQFVR